MLLWKPEFETGVAEVDVDHKQFIQGLNDVETELRAGAGATQVAEMLAVIEAYAHSHFSREEACMHRLQCPTAAANRAAHEQFRENLARAKQRLQAPKAGALVAAQVHRELCDWIANHIMKIDSGLRSCVRRADRPPAPQS